MFCTRLANGGLFPTGDPIVPFVISPRFECLNKRTHTVHMALMGYLIVFSCDQTRPNLRISLVGYHCAIEFPCGVLLFYCCKYPTTTCMAYASTHTHTHTQSFMTIPSEDFYCFFFCCLTQDNPIDFVHERRPRTAENKEPTREDLLSL